MATIPKITPAISTTFSEKVIPLISKAKKSIDILVYDWRWYPDQPAAKIQLFNQAIVQAKKRGVHIRALIQKPKVIETLKSLKFEAKNLDSERTVHTKAMIIDRRCVVLGSHNYTFSAFELNLEASVIIEDYALADSFTEYFNNLFST